MEETFILLDFGHQQTVQLLLEQLLLKSKAKPTTEEEASQGGQEAIKLVLRNINSNTPIVEIGDTCFQTSIHEPLGTHLVLDDRLDEVAAVDRIIKCKQISKGGK